MPCLVGYNSYTNQVSAGAAIVSGAGVTKVGSFPFPSQAQELLCGVSVQAYFSDIALTGFLIRVDQANSIAIGATMAFQANDVCFLTAVHEVNNLALSQTFRTLNEVMFYPRDHGMMVGSNQELGFYYISNAALGATIDTLITTFSRPATYQS